jgi:transposase
MKEISIIGVDLAKNVFQLRGAAVDGTVVFRKKLTRQPFQRFMAEHSQWRRQKKRV